MRLLAQSLVLTLAACASPGTGPEPSLAPRAAEAIDPRVPIPSTIPPGMADPALARRLDELIRVVRAGVPAFEERESEAARLAAAAGPESSESWITAQQALSRLVEQFGVTTRAAADIDALASTRVQERRWITAADQAAISEAASAVASISASQAASIERIREQIAR